MLKSKQRKTPLQNLEYLAARAPLLLNKANEDAQAKHGNTHEELLGALYALFIKTPECMYSVPPPNVRSGRSINTNL